MEINYDWKTKLFSNRFEIYQNDMMKGELYKEGLSRKVKGDLNGRKILFETKGVFKFETLITDMNDNSTIARVRYTNWKAKSSILYQDKEYKWQFDNFLRSRWSVSDENGALIKFHSQPFRGTIISYTKDEILILTGFFIRNFLKQRSAEIAASA